MRDEEYSHEVERVPGMSDKPPPYDSLTFSSPPPKYESIVRATTIQAEDNKSNICFLWPWIKFKTAFHSFKSQFLFCSRFYYRVSPVPIKFRFSSCILFVPTILCAFQAVLKIPYPCIPKQPSYPTFWWSLKIPESLIELPPSYSSFGLPRVSLKTWTPLSALRAVLENPFMNFNSFIHPAGGLYAPLLNIDALIHSLDGLDESSIKFRPYYQPFGRSERIPE